MTALGTEPDIDSEPDATGMESVATMSETEPEGAPAEQAAPSDLSALNKSQLMEMAAAAGFEGIKSTTTKDELIQMLSEKE